MARHLVCGAQDLAKLACDLLSAVDIEMVAFVAGIGGLVDLDALAAHVEVDVIDAQLAR